MKTVKHYDITQQNDGTYKLNIEFDDGSGQTESFDSFQAAQDYAVHHVATETDTPELAGSEMTVEQAEEINGNVQNAPRPPHAEVVESGAGQDPEARESNDEGSTIVSKDEDDKTPDQETNDDSEGSEIEETKG